MFHLQLLITLILLYYSEAESSALLLNSSKDCICFLSGVFDVLRKTFLNVILDPPSAKSHRIVK